MFLRGFLFFVFRLSCWLVEWKFMVCLLFCLSYLIHYLGGYAPCVSFFAVFRRHMDSAFGFRLRLRRFSRCCYLCFYFFLVHACVVGMWTYSFLREGKERKRRGEEGGKGGEGEGRGGIKV